MIKQYMTSLPYRLTHRAALILKAYSEGVFPMADGRDGDVHWYLPNNRGIIPINKFHVPRRLGKTLRKGTFEISFDRAFARVMHACSAPRPGQPDTWINDDIVEAYCELHELGFAHSVETWRNGRLVGGLYGVALKGLFAGESMFSTATDASKVALVALVDRLRQRGFDLLDTQMYTSHLGQFGAVEIPNAEYQILLKRALQIDATF